MKKTKRKEWHPIDFLSLSFPFIEASKGWMTVNGCDDSHVCMLSTSIEMQEEERNSTSNDRYKSKEKGKHCKSHRYDVLCKRRIK